MSLLRGDGMAAAGHLEFKGRLEAWEGVSGL